MTGTIGKIVVASLLLLFGMVTSCNTVVLLTCFLILLMAFTCVDDLPHNIFLLLFLAAFFTFLVGGQFVYEFFGYQMFFSFDDQEYNYLNSALFVSLICIGIGYLFASKIKIKLRKTESTEIASPEIIRKIAKYSFYFLLIPYSLTLLEGIFNAITAGYAAYYTYESRLPGIIGELSEIFTVSFCVFLATFPTKEETRVPALIYVVLTVLTLFTGRRIYFVTQFFLILGYYLFRNRKHDVWIPRRTLAAIICVLPFLIVILYSIRDIRLGRGFQVSSMMDAFFNFFQQQGFSANLIGLEKRYEYALTDHCYSFYSILRFLRINPFSRFILGLPYYQNYTGSRENMALYSGSFARIISYIVMKARYLNGYGAGSCYIAELHHDFGYIGIVVGNLFYGYVLKKISNLQRGHVLRNTIYLLMFRNLLMAPRYNYDYPFFVVFSYGFWIYIMFAFFTANLLRKKIRKSEFENRDYYFS